MSTEAIFATLATLVGNAVNAQLKTALSRRFKLWDQVPPADQPAMFQLERKEVPVQKKGQPTKWKKSADLVIYVNGGQDPTLVPSTAINGLLDAVRAALAPDPATGFQQLLDANGAPQVSHCWISDIQINEGLLDPTGNQSMAIVAIEIEDLTADTRLFSFDTGYLFLSRPGTPTNWIKVGALTDVSLEVQVTGTDMRAGKYQTPIGYIQNSMDITGSAKFAKIDGALINELVFQTVQSPGCTLIQRDEFHVEPAAPYQITITPPASGVFATDLGVQYDATGVALKRVASNPVAGQYSLAGAVYTFAAADSGQNLCFCYSYTVTTGTQITLANQVQMVSPVFKLILSTANGQGQNNWTLNVVTGQKFIFPTQLEEFTVQEFTFDVVADGSNNIGQISFSPNN